MARRMTAEEMQLARQDSSAPPRVAPDTPDDERLVTYRATPTLTRFHRSRAFFRGVRGPVGAGKTTGAAWEMFMQAQAATPCRDGVRRTRVLAIRNTFGELKSTTIQTWEHWFGPQRGPQFGAIVYDVPIRQAIRGVFGGQRIEMDIWFLALDRPQHVRKLKSLEATWVWLNEASELPKEVLDIATTRVGRFPHADDMPDGHVGPWPGRYGIVADTNSVDDDHWWYQTAEEQKPKGFEFFDQPGGLEPDAENIEFLPGGRDYYRQIMEGKRQDWIDCYVHNRYVAVQEGKPIFPEFAERVHVSPDPLQVLHGLDLILGFDAGLTPACVICQFTPRGQLRVLEEICVDIEQGTMGMRRFAEDCVLPVLNSRKYRDLGVQAYADPGGNIRSQTDEETVIDVLNDVGIPAEPAYTNLFEPRRDAVSRLLRGLGDAGTPNLILDPGCKWLRKGLNGGYAFKRMQLAGEARYKDVPDKNKYSHVCFVAGTPITLADGTFKPVELVTLGDKVLTPYGSRQVTTAGSRREDTVIVTLSDGRSLQCTGDHPIWTPKGFVAAGQLQGGEIVADKGQTLWKHLFRFQRVALGRSGQYSSSVACAITGSRPATTRPKKGWQKHSVPRSIFTVLCGQPITALYRRGITSITRTVTAATTIPGIWRYCMVQSMSLTTCVSRTTPLPPVPGLSSTLFLQRPSGGRKTLTWLLKLAAVAPPAWLRQSALTARHSCVRFAAISTKRTPGSANADSVRRSASQRLAEQVAWMTNNGRALSAAQRSISTATKRLRPVRVVAVERSQPARVFNLTVSDAHCYYANGVLVSNCEALQYASVDLMAEVLQSTNGGRSHRQPQTPQGPAFVNRYG